MTVEQLIQQLVELAARGRGQWSVNVWMGQNEYYPGSCQEAKDVICYEETKEVVIE